MTQEFSSQMLGVHRPSVTLALQTLAEAGLIRTESRGRIRILDAQGLEVARARAYGGQRTSGTRS